jgi:hypothetical protein
MLSDWIVELAWPSLPDAAIVHSLPRDDKSVLHENRVIFHGTPGQQASVALEDTILSNDNWVQPTEGQRGEMNTRGQCDGAVVTYLKTPLVLM